MPHFTTEHWHHASFLLHFSLMYQCVLLNTYQAEINLPALIQTIRKVILPQLDWLNDLVTDLLNWPLQDSFYEQKPAWCFRNEMRWFTSLLPVPTPISTASTPPSETDIALRINKVPSPVYTFLCFGSCLFPQCHVSPLLSCSLCFSPTGLLSILCNLA